MEREKFLGELAHLNVVSAQLERSFTNTAEMYPASIAAIIF